MRPLLLPLLLAACHLPRFSDGVGVAPGFFDTGGRIDEPGRDPLGPRLRRWSATCDARRYELTAWLARDVDAARVWFVGPDGATPQDEEHWLFDRGCGETCKEHRWTAPLRPGGGEGSATAWSCDTLLGDGAPGVTYVLLATGRGGVALDCVAFGADPAGVLAAWRAGERAGPAWLDPVRQRCRRDGEDPPVVDTFGH